MGTPLALNVSGVLDANGNASTYLRGFTPGRFAQWNLAVQVPGNAPQVTILQAGSLVGSANVIAGTASVGPIPTAPSVPVQVNVTGGLPGATFSGTATGVESPDPTDGDLVNLPGIAAGNVGTVAAYDGPTLLSELGVTHGGDGALTGIVPVQNWASSLLGLRMTQLGGSCTGALVTFRWYANPDGTRLVGQRAMALDLIVPTLVATIPNLGPYLQVVVNRLGPGGGSFTWNASLLSSNRLVPDVFGGNFTPYLVEVYSATAAPSTTTDYPFGTVYGGPIHIALTNNASSPGNITGRLTVLGTDGAYHANASSDVVSNSVVGQDTEIIAPPVSCQLRLITAATAGTYTYTVLVYASATGGT